MLLSCSSHAFEPTWWIHQSPRGSRWELFIMVRQHLSGAADCSLCKSLMIHDFLLHTNLASWLPLEVVTIVWDSSAAIHVQAYSAINRQLSVPETCSSTFWAAVVRTWSWHGLYPCLLLRSHDELPRHCGAAPFRDCILYSMHTLNDANGSKIVLWRLCLKRYTQDLLHQGYSHYPACRAVEMILRIQREIWVYVANVIGLQ